MARGLRLSSELVAGVLVGGLIGWLLDRWLGISPWALIVFLLLGFAAGVLNVMRSAGLLAEPLCGKAISPRASRAGKRDTTEPVMANPIHQFEIST